MPASIANLDRYRDLVARWFKDEVKGKANPYTSMNGNMYSFLDKTGTVCLRLPRSELAAYQTRFGTGPVVQYGAVMKDYVAVPEPFLADDAVMADVLALCRDYAENLPKK